MYIELDPWIEIFIKDNFTHYMGNEIKESFTLFNDYGIVDYDFPFIGILTLQSNQDPQQTIADFMALLNNQLDYILLVHGITLIDQVPVDYKNTILRGMFSFIDALPEVKELMINFVDDEEINDEQKLSHVIEYFSDKSFLELMPIVQKVEPSLILKIRQLITTEDAILTSNPESILNFKLFKQFMDSEYKDLSFNIATSIVLSSFPLGLPLSDYLPFISHMLGKLPPERLVVELFSLYVISEEFSKGDFMEIYTQFYEYLNEHNITEDEIISPDANEANLFLKLSNEFESYKIENNL